MGLLDRIEGVVNRGWHVVDSAIEAGENVVLMPYDLGRAAFTDDDYDGILGTIYGITANRGGRAIEELLGPQGVTGEAVGGLPEAVRGPARGPIAATFEGLETAGREVIREPIATMLLAGSLAEARSGQGFGGVAELVNPETWRDAHDLAQTTSPGQALALAIGTKDITNPTEVADFVNSDYYRMISGTTDAALRWFYDVDVLAGRGIIAGRQGLRGIDRTPEGRLTELAKMRDEAANTGDFGRASVLDNLVESARAREARKAAGEVPLQPGDWQQLGVDTFFQSRAWERMRTGVDQVKAETRDPNLLTRGDEIGGSELATSTERIRDRFFHDDPHGAVKASALARASGADELEAVMRFFMGDLRQLRSRRLQSAALRSDLTDMARETALINRNVDQFNQGLFREQMQNDIARRDELVAAADEIKDELRILDAEHPLFASTQTQPRATTLGAAREVAKRSWVYQDSPFRAFRAFFQMVPDRHVDVNDANSVVNVRRTLESARLPIEQVDELAGRYAQATTPQQRTVALSQIEHRALSDLADEFGLSRADVDEIVEAAAQGRATAREWWAGRRYGTDGRARMVVKDEAGVTNEMPLMVTQTADVVPMPDFRRLRAELEWHSGSIRGELRKLADNPVIEWPRELLTTVMKVWVPFTLARPAWPIRVVTDEQFRMAAKFGASAQALDRSYRLSSLTKPAFGNTLSRLGELWRLTEPSRLAGRFGLDSTRGTTGGIAAVTAGTLAAGPAGLAVGGATFGALKAMERLERAGYPQLAFDGWKMQGAFGATADQQELWRQQVSIERGLNDLMLKDETGLLGRWRTQASDWVVAKPGDAHHLRAWAHVLNNQIAQDKVARQFLAGRTVDDVMDKWLPTAEGQLYLDEIPWRRKDPEQWLTNLKEQVDEYTRGNPELVRAARDRAVDEATLERLFDEADRPHVHAPAVEQVTYSSAIDRFMNETIDNVMQTFGRIPTDELSRSPFFAKSYENYMRNATQGLDPAHLNWGELRSIEDAARQYAIGQTRHYLYELSERSEFGEAVKLMVPFFGAWQEVLTRWAGLAVENPTVIPRAMDIWNAPNKAGLVVEDERSGDKFIRFRLPEWAAPLANAAPFFSGALDSQGQVRFPKDSFNMILQGLPSGPPVDLAVAQFVEANPQLEDDLSFFFPFGPPTGSLVDQLKDTFEPTTVRNLRNMIFDGEMNAITAGRIIQTKLLQMQQGELPPVDLSDPATRNQFIEDAKTEARRLNTLRGIAQFISPATPIFDSPYWMYEQELTKLQDQFGFEEGFDRFIEQHGAEFATVAEGITESLNGIPPTFAGEEFDSEWRPFLNTLENPEMEGWVFALGGFGADSTDEFSRVFYDKQLSTPVRPGADDRQRERRSLLERATNPQANQAWREYAQKMDLIDAARIEMGLPNLQVKEAAELKAAKAAIVADLEKRFPLWAQERGQLNTNMWKSRLSDVTRILDNPNLAGRGAVPNLRLFLEARERVLAEVARRGVSSINTETTVDLERSWLEIVGQLTRDPAFHRFYYRFLENVPMTLETSLAALNQGEAA